MWVPFSWDWPHTTYEIGELYSWSSASRCSLSSSLLSMFSIWNITLGHSIEQLTADFFSLAFYQNQHVGFCHRNDTVRPTARLWKQPVSMANRCPLISLIDLKLCHLLILPTMRHVNLFLEYQFDILHTFSTSRVWRIDSNWWFRIFFCCIQKKTESAETMTSLFRSPVMCKRLCILFLAW